MLCAYCLDDYDQADMTGEHVIPRSLGGVIQPTNPFKLSNVCQRCNTIAGLYVDRPFVRSWITHNIIATAYTDFADIETTPTLPLTYMGYLDGAVFREKEVEVWLGPAGDNIFHVHDEVADEDKVIVGSSRVGKRFSTDPGFVFVLFRTNNQFWASTCVNSVRDKFPKSTLYVGNPRYEIKGDSPFEDIPDDLVPLRDRFLSYNKNGIKIIQAFYPDADLRFLAKFGLGMGCLFLSDYLESEEAAKLRYVLRQKELAENERVDVKIIRFINKLDGMFMSTFGWSAGIVVSLQLIEGSLMATLNIYGKACGSIEISRNQDHWKDFLPSDSEGLFFLIAPQTQSYIGPIDIADFIEAKARREDVTPFHKFLSVHEKKPDHPPF